MKQVWLISCLILMGVRAVRAQQPNPNPRHVYKFVPPAPDQSYTRYIDLGKPGKDETLPQQMNISGVRFLDNRIDTSSIGFARDVDVDFPNWTSTSFRLAKVNFNGSLPDIFSDYVNANFKGSFSATGDSLVIVINYFRVSSKSDHFSDIDPQLIKLNLLFARKEADRIFILGEYDTLLAFKGRSAQPYYTAPVKKALKEVMLKANELMIAVTSPAEILPEDAFLKKYTGRFSTPVLQSVVLEKGAYGNFRQALTNSPQYPRYDPAFTEIVTYDIIVKDTNGVRIGFNKIWGYCDGNTIYVFSRHGGADVYPLIKKGNSLIVSLRNADSAADRTSARIVNGYMVIAAILTHGIAGSAVNDQIGPPVVTVRAGRKTYQTVGAEINMETGEIDF
jgi:hypothetical protein